LRAALGIIETIGFTAAVTALDAATKAADVTFVGYDKAIGVEKAISVLITFAGEVAAVKAAVEAGTTAANRVGRVVSSHVIPRPHEEVDRLIEEFTKNLEKKRKSKQVEVAKSNAVQKKPAKNVQSAQTETKPEA
jgi:ethanolamine utilization protein EutM